VARSFTPSEEEDQAVSEVIREYLDLGACLPIERKQVEWVSPVFGRPKQGSAKWRLIADLSVLNRHVVNHHFKMESLQTAVSMATPNCFFCKLDLSSAYFHLGMAPPTRAFLGFTWGGRWLQWQALPFGLSTAPRVFSKLMRQAVKYARAHGVCLVIYIDDLLIMGATREKCRLHAIATAAWLQHLGLTVNWKKSILTPCQEIEFLGLVLNSVTQQVLVGPEKLAHIQREAIRLSQKTTLNVRTLAAFEGKLVALRPAIRPCLLHLRWIDLCKTQAVRTQGWEGTATLTAQALDELLWWAEHAQEENGARWSHPPPTWVMTTDAALDNGWGATLERVTSVSPVTSAQLVHPTQLRLPPSQQAWHLTTGSSPRSPTTPQPMVAPTMSCGSRTSSTLAPPKGLLEARGLWTPEERHSAVSINRFELEASLRAIRCFPHQMRDCTVTWRADNQVCVYCTQKWKAKSTDLLSGLLELWQLCKERHIHLLPEYIPGVENTRADELSRRSEKQDWQLNPILYRRITKIRYQPTVDAFASNRNRQTTRFWSWVWEEETAGVDFFDQSLAGEWLWANPPFSLLDRVLDTVRRQQAHMLLVVPKWTTASWWPTAVSLQTAPPLLLPRVENLYIPKGILPAMGPPHWDSLCLQISGNPAEVAEANELWGEERLQQEDTQLVDWWWKRMRPQT
jgi:hypothetical protein